MKKLLSLALTAALLLTLFACGGSADPVPNAPLVLGEKYLSDLDYEQALLQFDQAIEIEPKNPRGYLGKADALLHLERQEEAVQTLTVAAKAVAKDQRDAMQIAQAEVEKSAVDGYIGLSAAYEKLGWREIALLLLQRVCEELPEESRLREALERLFEAIESTEPSDYSALVEYSYRNLSYSFDWTLGLWEDEPEALGSITVEFTLVGILENVAAVYPAAESIKSWTYSEIEGLAEQITKQLWEGDWEPSSNQELFDGRSGVTGSIDANDLGKSINQVWLVLNRECEAIGYVLITIDMPATAE